MLLQQFYLGCLAHASYLIADEATRRAVVVDPQRDIDRYLTYASEHQLTISDVFLTHFHADFVAGHLELRNRTGATIRLGRTAQAEYAFVPMGNGDALEFGDVRIEVLETPGHTPESISLVVFDLAGSSHLRSTGSGPQEGTARRPAGPKGPALRPAGPKGPALRPAGPKGPALHPYAVLTGDTLFVGDVGRPDLRASLGWSAGDLGAMLYDSLRDRLLTLPDNTVVMPAHGAGSLCGKAISKELTSTIGEQRRFNYALQPMAKQAFIDLVTADQPDAPSYFTYDAVLNTRERPTLDAALSRELTPMTLDDVLTAVADGAQLLDTRDAAVFGAAHLAGTLNIGLGGQYATWAGTILKRDTPIVLVTDPGAESESALRLGRIGFDHVKGFLAGGLAAAASRPDLVTTTERVSPERAKELFAAGAVGVDVRMSAERASKFIEGTLHLPLNHLEERVAELPSGTQLLVFCAGGYRSSIAASLLGRLGFDRVMEIAGGQGAWEAAGLPVSGNQGKE
jgi:glyoxylase-like metal-dependent hydrolase (beta-lactamase superfamily II)/rhodanese-related sulfurtransferase